MKLLATISFFLCAIIISGQTLQVNWKVENEPVVIHDNPKINSRTEYHDVAVTEGGYMFMTWSQYLENKGLMQVAVLDTSGNEIALVQEEGEKAYKGKLAALPDDKCALFYSRLGGSLSREGKLFLRIFDKNGNQATEEKTVFEGKILTHDICFTKDGRIAMSWNYIDLNNSLNTKLQYYNQAGEPLDSAYVINNEIYHSGDLVLKSVKPGELILYDPMDRYVPLMKIKENYVSDSLYLPAGLRIFDYESCEDGIYAVASESETYQNIHLFRLDDNLSIVKQDTINYPRKYNVSYELEYINDQLYLVYPRASDLILRVMDQDFEKIAEKKITEAELFVFGQKFHDNFLVFQYDFEPGRLNYNKIGPNLTVFPFEEPVNNYAKYSAQGESNSSINKTGDQAVVWTDNRNYSSEIYLKTLNQNNEPLSDEIKVGEGYSPAVDIANADRILVTWFYDNVNGRAIKGRLFNKDGSAITEEFIVIESDSVSQVYEGAKPLHLADDRFGVFFHRQDTDDIGTYFKLYNSNGTALSGIKKVFDKTYTMLRVKSDDNGNFYVLSYIMNIFNDPPSSSIEMKIFNKNGTLQDHKSINFMDSPVVDYNIGIKETGEYAIFVLYRLEDFSSTMTEIRMYNFPSSNPLSPSYEVIYRAQKVYKFEVSSYDDYYVLTYIENDLNKFNFILANDFGPIGDTFTYIIPKMAEPNYCPNVFDSKLYLTYSDNKNYSPDPNVNMMTLSWEVGITGLDDKEDRMTEYMLHSNYPNPFNPSTTISFSLPHESNVKILLYNLLGEEVAVVANQKYEAGSYDLKFNAGDLPSGVYLYRMEAGAFSQTRKMILLK